MSVRDLYDETFHWSPDQKLLDCQNDDGSLLLDKPLPTPYNTCNVSALVFILTRDHDVHKVVPSQ